MKTPKQSVVNKFSIKFSIYLQPVVNNLQEGSQWALLPGIQLLWLSIPHQISSKSQKAFNFFSGITHSEKPATMTRKHSIAL